MVGRQEEGACDSGCWPLPALALLPSLPSHGTAWEGVIWPCLLPCAAGLVELAGSSRHFWALPGWAGFRVGAKAGGWDRPGLSLAGATPLFLPAQPSCGSCLLDSMGSGDEPELCLVGVECGGIVGTQGVVWAPFVPGAASGRTVRGSEHSWPAPQGLALGPPRDLLKAQKGPVLGLDG